MWSAGERPQCFFIARDDKGEYVRVLEYSNHPGLRPPLQWRGTGYVPLRSKVPLYGGVARSAGGGYCTPPPDGLTTGMVLIEQESK